MKSLPLKKKVNHYVPEFYLNEFSDPDDVSDNPRLWVYDIENPIPRKISTNRIAKIKNYYRLYHQGVVDDSLDNALQHFETEAAPIFKELRGNNIPFSDVHTRYQFGRFISFLLVRTPQFKKHINILSQNKAKTRLIEKFNKDGDLKETVKKINKTGKEGFTEEEFISSFNKLKIELLPNAFQLVLLEAAKKMILSFCNMNWHFLRSEPEFAFVTSDAPVFIYNPDEKDNSIWYGYERRNSEFIFPVNRNLCLITTRNRKEGYFNTNKDVVYDLNDKILSHALRYLFSPVQYKMKIEENI